MSKVFIQESTLTAIGDAIRTQTGGSDLIAPGDMPREILAIETGGGGLPDDAFAPIGGNCTGMFANGLWAWYLRDFGNKITTKDITNASNMFSRSSNLKSLSFDLNFKSYSWDTLNLNAMFQNCINLEEVTINCTGGKPSSLNCYNTFAECQKLHTLNLNFDFGYAPGNSIYGMYNLLSYCFDLREVVNLPFVYSTYDVTYGWGDTTYNCPMLSRFVFIPDQVITESNYKGVNIDLTSPGWSQYGSGKDDKTDKQVIDAATYEALKDDPEWWTMDVKYSRYNHDSAVETINSLPDVSSTGETSTIGFYADAGTLNGGAIGSMTDAEIAVAAAKGWTVTLY